MAAPAGSGGWFGGGDQYRRGPASRRPRKILWPTTTGEAWGGFLAADVLFGARVDREICPRGCRLCLDACPVGALDGVTVDQAKCRPRSITTRGRGFTVYDCNACRRACPHLAGVRSRR